MRCHETTGGQEHPCHGIVTLVNFPSLAVVSRMQFPEDDATAVSTRGEILPRRGEAEDVDRGAVGGAVGDEAALECGGGELALRPIRRNDPDLDVVVGAGGGEAVGGGVEVEAEHRLQVVPVDLHRPAPHPGLLPVFLLDRWVGFLPISLYLSFARALSL